MQNRFGFKDGVMLVLLFIVGLLVVIGMFGNDRVLEQVQKVEGKVAELEQVMATNSGSGAELDSVRNELNAIRDAIKTGAREIDVDMAGRDAME